MNDRSKQKIKSFGTHIDKPILRIFCYSECHFLLQRKNTYGTKFDHIRISSCILLVASYITRKWL